MPQSLPHSVCELIDALRSDNVHGAAAVTKLAAEAIRVLAREVPGAAAPPCSFPIADAARALVFAQPAMAPILNLVNTVLWRTDEAANPAEQADRAVAACDEFVKRMDSAGERIALRALQLLTDGTVFITHSASETVLGAVCAARRSGRRLRAICTESRPAGEGIGLARKLAAEGIAVTLISDGAMFHAMPDAAFAAVGADAVSIDGVVNKMGTALLALAAKHYFRGFYVLCGTEKLVPAGHRLPREPCKPASELLPEPAPGVTVRNLYFETTPLDLVTAVITEQGDLGPADVRRKLAQGRIHPSLISRTDSAA